MGLVIEDMNFKITKMSIDFYRSLGYNVNLGDVIKIKSSELSPGSHVPVRVVCDVCGKERVLAYQVYYKSFKNGGFYACTSKCAQSKVIQTSQKKFGAEYYSQTKECQDRIVKTSVEKYGVSHFTQADEVKERLRQTLLKQYGVDNYSKTEEFRKLMREENPYAREDVKDKIRETCEHLYGKPHYLQTEDGKRKTKESMLEKYGVDRPIHIEGMRERIAQKNLSNFGHRSALSLKENREKGRRKRIENYLKRFEREHPEIHIISYDVDSKVMVVQCDLGKDHTFEIGVLLFRGRMNMGTVLCTTCNPIGHHTSGLELQLLEYVRSLVGESGCTSGDRTVIRPYELDVYVPDRKVAFEFDGLYWHSSAVVDNDKQYMKTRMCREAGVRLFHVFEDDWVHRGEIVRSMVGRVLGVFERIDIQECRVSEVGLEEARTFLKQNHVRGYTPSSLRVGLHRESELVSLMTFRTREGVTTLTNYGSKNGTWVDGGGRMMLGYALDHLPGTKVVTTVDQSWPENGVYEGLGFHFVEEVPPTFWYVIEETVERTMHSGTNRIYDCGYFRYELSR